MCFVHLLCPQHCLDHHRGQIAQHLVGADWQLAIQSVVGWHAPIVRAALASTAVTTEQGLGPYGQAKFFLEHSPLGAMQSLQRILLLVPLQDALQA